LIEALFTEERTKTEVADAMDDNQSMINRCKQAIVNGLNNKLRDRHECEGFFCIKIPSAAIYPLLVSWGDHGM